VATIRQLLSSQTYENERRTLTHARHSVLHTHNLFAMLADYWRDNLKPGPPRWTSLLPKSHRASLVARQLSRTLLCSA
jgi:hypothetical protein